jgi:1-acyl-sn-glycerol-3-phosphate acyltransferase
MRTLAGSLEEARIVPAAERSVVAPAVRLRPLPRILRTLLRWILLALFRFEIEGLERLPRRPYIVAANHPAWLETMTLIAFLPAERGLRFLASRAATFVGWRRTLLKRADAVLPFDMESGSEARTAIRRAVELLEGGSSIGIFPEDLTQPTTPDGTVRPLRRGVAMLARVSGVPVVPVGVADTRELWRGRRIRIVVGEPIAPPRERGEDEAFLAALHERIEALRPRQEPLPARRPWPWLSKLF